MTSFTWLDYSEHERRQAMDVIDLFREDDTRDELGLGTIRDALADHLFPGTSTIQTRARYFLFVPWIYQEVDRRGVAANDFAGQVRKLHGRLCQALVDGGEETGVIGFRARENVQRLPSSVYWAGLRKWGIVIRDGSEDDFRRAVLRVRNRAKDWVAPDGGEGLDMPDALWHSHLPKPPANWLTSSSFTLTPAEADYLISRVAEMQRGTLLAYMLTRRLNAADDVEFAWSMRWPADLPEPLQVALMHAQNFAEVMHGAALVYNLLLSERKQNPEWIERYRDELLLAWRETMRLRESHLSKWDRGAFWEFLRHLNARVPIPTRDFVNEWLRCVIDGGPAPDVAESAATRELVRNRERQIKKGRARLREDDTRAIELWNGSSGSAMLDYRWNRPVRAIVNDILSPVTGPPAGAAHA